VIYVLNALSLRKWINSVMKGLFRVYCGWVPGSQTGWRGLILRYTKEGKNVIRNGRPPRRPVLSSVEERKKMCGKEREVLQSQDVSIERAEWNRKGDSKMRSAAKARRNLKLLN